MKTYQEILDDVFLQMQQCRTTPTRLYVSEDIENIITDYARKHCIYPSYLAEYCVVQKVYGLTMYVVKDETNHVKVC